MLFSQFLSQKEVPLIIQNIVNRVHISTSDEELINYVISRLKQKSWRALPEEEQNAFKELVLLAHKHNRDLFNCVATGDFTTPTTS